MLTALERMNWVTTLVAIAVFVAAYLFVGPPSTVPAIELTYREVVDRETFLNGTSTTEMDVPDAPTNTVYRVVSPGFVESINNLNRAFNEAKKLESKFVVRGGRQGLMVSGIRPSSLAKGIGLAEGDVILEINDHPLEAEKLGATAVFPGSEAQRLYEQFLETAESGGVIRLEILRKDRPLEIQVRVDE